MTSPTTFGGVRVSMGGISCARRSRGRRSRIRSASLATPHTSRFAVTTGSAVTRLSASRPRASLTDLSGWTRGEIRGETESEMGISVSRVRAEYEKGESSLTFELMDTSLNANLLTPFQMASKAGVEERRADGYTKATTVAGYPAVEEWSTEAKNGSIALLAGGRYLLTVTGSTVPDVATTWRSPA